MSELLVSLANIQSPFLRFQDKRPEVGSSTQHFEMLDLLPPELIFMIITDLQPFSQYSLAFTSRRLWSILGETVGRHRHLSQECAYQLQNRHNILAIYGLGQIRPDLLPYVKHCEFCYYGSCPCSIYGGFASTPPFDMCGDSRNPHHFDYDIVVSLLPHLQNLTWLEFLVPQCSRMKPLFGPSSNSLQFLTHIFFRGKLSPLPISWLHTALRLPNIRFIHGHLLHYRIGMPTSKRATISSPPSSTIKELIITNSGLDTLDPDMSHVLMETFLYNFVETNPCPAHDPSRIISRLPKSLKHLAILEKHVRRLHHRKSRFCPNKPWILVVPSSLMQFQQPKTLWCFWPAVVPVDADLENFDLSSVLPRSLTWLILFSVPEEGVKMLTRALPKMPCLKMIWAQVREFHGEQRGFGFTSNREVQLTKQFQSTVCKAGLTWAGLEHPSVFTSYMRYLQIHERLPQPRRNDWMVGNTIP